MSDTSKPRSSVLIMAASILLIMTVSALAGCVSDPANQDTLPEDEGDGSDGDDGSDGEDGEDGDDGDDGTDGGDGDENKRPQAAFAIEPLEPVEWEQVVFNASLSEDEDGTIERYSWDFDVSDGIMEDAVGMEALHVFKESGSYTVTLTVADEQGSTDTESMTVVVAEGTMEGEIEVPITTDEGNTGTVSRPLNPTASADSVHHFQMPEGATRIVATLMWEDSSWDLDLSFGTGDDASGGQVYASDSGEGFVRLEFVSSGNVLEEAQWFVQITPTNADSHTPVIESASYEITVTAYTLI